MIKQIAFFLLLSHSLFFGALDRIQKAMDKKEYEKAYELIIKGYEKEPNNPGISYYHAKLLFEEAYAKYHLDSARIAIENAKEKFNEAPQELKEEIIKVGITLDTIDLLHENIRDQAFQNTLRELSVSEAQSFQKKFPNSIYDDLLVYKIDSIKFRQARLSEQEIKLVAFLEDNPASAFRHQADSILDDMRYAFLNANGDLKDHYAFHKEYPSSRHLAKIESYVLKGSTASHDKQNYHDFISFAQTKALKKKAADVLFYLSNKQDLLSHPNQDSLSGARSLSQVALYPVIQNDLYGFYDQWGQSRIESLYEEIYPDYKCELTKDDWIYAEDKNGGLILTKNGTTVLSDIDGYRSVSDDVGLINQEGDWYLYHKSGFKIIDRPVEAAEIIANKWIKVKSENYWGLFSYMGLQVAEPIYDGISKLEAFWVFEKNDLLAVYTEALILSEIEERGVSLEFKFDDIELVDKNKLIGFRGARECLLDSTLNFLIPWGEYEIYPEASGWYLRSDQGYQFYSKSEEDIMTRIFSYMESNAGWLALKTELDWMLIPGRGTLSPSRYDSIKLVNDYSAMVLNNDEKTLLFTSGEKIPITDERIRTFQNREGFLNLINEEQMTIFDPNGKEIITGKFQKASFLNDTLIRVQIRGKQGLINVNGDWVLNPVFDSLDEKDGLILTLIDGKIGCFDLLINELIPTEYDARVVRLSSHYLVKKEGKFGVIDRNKTEVISFDYDKITFWNDTSFLVKKEEQFFIINREEEPLYDAIESVTLFSNNDSHSIYRFIKNGRYGLFSNAFGVLLEAEFTDILNIGSEENPLIFADQHLDKAGFHVVSYVNEKGVLIHSKAYTREEFEGILCDD
ncbi:MAG: WG repeat-containing protein [Ekhidna sp.]